MTEKWELNSFISYVFEHMVEGVLCIDAEGVVLYANASYLNFIHKTPEEVIGYKLQEIRPHAQLPLVVETGQPILHAQRLEDLEEAYFVNMYPVYDGDKIIGGFSSITFMEQALRNRIELENYESTSQKLLKQVNQQGSRYTFDSIIAVSPESRATKAYALRLADGDMTVLLESESGTGKEVFAQSIHNASRRKNGVFLAVNCAGFSKDMLESELFGYAEGAFTGAKKGGKIGLFEAASGGTLFLDEIAEMDLGLQAKLLRALQEHKIRPIGAVKEIDVDVRIICACNVDLKKRVEEGRFRQDLYYRINSFPIRILPLRDRREDIPALVESILSNICEKEHRTITISEPALDCLMQYDWPGNVRELRNIVEFAAYISIDGRIDMLSLPDQLRFFAAGSQTEERPDLAERVRTFEKNEIKRTLAAFGNTVDGKKKAAKQLNISLATLYNKLKE